MNRYKCVGAIVFAGQKLAQLELIELVGQTIVFDRHFFFCLRAMRRIALFRGEFLQRAEVLDLAFQLLEWIE